MPRYGCRKCRSPLPAVQAGEALRVRCPRADCGFVNVIPADPKLAPWEARGASSLEIADSPQGAVLLAPLLTQRRSHMYWQIIIAAVTVLLMLAVISIPSVRAQIAIAWAIHEIRSTDDARTAQRWCEVLEDLGRTAQRAAPDVWALRDRKFNGGRKLRRHFLAAVARTIDPDYPVDDPGTTQQSDS